MNIALLVVVWLGVGLVSLAGIWLLFDFDEISVAELLFFLAGPLCTLVFGLLLVAYLVEHFYKWANGKTVFKRVGSRWTIYRS